jgi:hypothetical protein
MTNEIIQQDGIMQYLKKVDDVNDTNFQINYEHYIEFKNDPLMAVVTVVVSTNDVKEIPHGMFRGNKSLRQICFHGGVIHIGNEAFEGCSSLERIVLPLNVESVGVRAFSRCIKLQDVIIESPLLTTLEDGLFSHCIELRSFRVPVNISVIGNGVFEKCRRMVTVRMNDRTEMVGMNAFRGFEQFLLNV